MTCAATGIIRFVLPIAAMWLGCLATAAPAQDTGNPPANASAAERSYEWLFPATLFDLGLGYIDLGSDIQGAAGSSLGLALEWHSAQWGPVYLGVSCIPLGAGTIDVDYTTVIDHIVSRWMVSARGYLPVTYPGIYMQAGLGLQWDSFRAAANNVALFTDEGTADGITFFHPETSLIAGLEFDWFVFQIGWTASLDAMTLRFTDDVAGERVYSLKLQHRVYMMLGVHVAWGGPGFAQAGNTRRS